LALESLVLGGMAAAAAALKKAASQSPANSHWSRIIARNGVQAFSESGKENGAAVKPRREE